jgi:pimeloyl-ACP methyl ester carboxylesterase
VTVTGVRRAVGTAVVLPGTGSDEVFVRAVFGEPAAEARLHLVTPAPKHGSELAEHHLAALDAAADRYGRIVVGGISLGAHLAAEWAAANPDRCAGLLAAMPGWYGAPDTADGTAPGSTTADVSAAAVAADGIDAALAAATRDVPAWLADELDRAWRRAGAGLAASLRVAVDRPAPSLDLLAGITAPAGVAGCVDDPVHPIGVAARWTEALPSAELHTVTFAELGADRAALGRAALAGLLGRMHDQVGDDDPDDDGGGDGAEGQW